MRRCLLTVLIVAALSAWINRAERAPAAAVLHGDWVRTVDGWEPRQVLAPRPARPPRHVHPGLVAALQLGVSLMALMAFPGRVATLAPSHAPAARRRQRRRAAAHSASVG